MKRGLGINDAQQVETMLRKSGRPRLTGRKTLPARQNEEGGRFLQMWTSRLFVAKKLNFYTKICCVYFTDKGVEQCVHFSDKGESFLQCRRLLQTTPNCTVHIFHGSAIIFGKKKKHLFDDATYPK